MRIFWTGVATTVLALVATRVTEGRSNEQFVLIKFSDQHVSLFVLAEGELSKFRTEGSGMQVVADCSKHAIEVSGSGAITYKNDRIVFSSKGIAINGKPLSAEAKNFTLFPNGEVRQGFVRSFDREPHKH